MFAAEGGQRGFLISNDDTYLDAYRESLVNIPKIGAVIRERVADNPPQRALLANLESESNARLGLLELALNARRARDEAAVRASFSSHRGRDAMLRVRAILKAMRTTEERLLAQRRDAADGFARLLTAVMLVGLGALAAALYYWIASSREQHAALAATNDALRGADCRERGGLGANAANAEDGSRRSAHRRHRARLQQYAGRHHGRHLVGAAPHG
ncbi:MAG: CHASE3 domain-containing protein [Hyphomicrobium sp.]